jgi:hypothetical protein
VISPWKIPNVNLEIGMVSAFWKIENRNPAPGVFLAGVVSKLALKNRRTPNTKTDYSDHIKEAFLSSVLEYIVLHYRSEAHSEGKAALQRIPG